MKIVSLLENVAFDSNVQVEHGLSLYIETKGRKILFDMGGSDLFAKNAQTLGINLKEVDLAVISHGHGDHGGGLKTFLSVNDHAPVFVQPSAFDAHYNVEGKFIGLDESLKHNPRVITVGDFCKIADGATIYSCNDLLRTEPLPDLGFTAVLGGVRTRDTFEHEQHMIIEEDGVKTLFSGCTHKGITQVTKWFKPDFVVGGFHFAKYGLNEDLASLAKELDLLGATYYTCHCTGTAQFEFIKKYISRLHYFACGQTICI